MATESTSHERHLTQRWAALLLVVVLTVAGTATAIAAPPRSIAELENSLRTGSTTCRAVVSEALERIRVVESGPLRPRAVREVNPDALAIADALDAEQSAGTLRPLHCLPLLVKDNYATGDRLTTTVGSILLKDFRADEDALVVARLRAAGAVVLGKTNMDEWAHGANGYNSISGQTRNGLRGTRGPGGSSGGSGSAIAHDLALVATGSDTGGSIQIPANFNGVVGLRSTMGLVSRAGIAPYASVTDVAGPLTGSVEDAARVLGFLTGVDPADPATGASAGLYRTDYTPFLDEDALRGARIGVLRSVFGVPLTGDSKAIDSAFQRALKRMRAAGATVVELPNLRGPQERWLDVGPLVQRQFRPELNAWLQGPARAAGLRDLAEVIADSRRPPAEGRVKVLPGLISDQKAGPRRGRVWDASELGVRKFRRSVEQLIATRRLDAIAYPASSCPPPPLPGTVDPTYRCQGDQPPFAFGEGAGSPAALLSPATGLPVLNFPGPGIPGGLKVGVTLLGPRWSEGELLGLGYAYERAGG